MEDFTDHARRLLEVELAVVRHDACCILSAVLQDDETVIEFLNDVSVAGNSKDATHDLAMGNGETRPALRKGKAVGNGGTHHAGIVQTRRRLTSAPERMNSVGDPVTATTIAASRHLILTLYGTGRRVVIIAVHRPAW